MHTILKYNLFLAFCGSLWAKPIEPNNDGNILMEAEETSSKLGSWEKSTEIEGFEGEGYLEFTGNSPINGDPKSHLKYEFKIKEDGIYYLHLRCAKETLTIKGEKRTDVANDCYVKVSGDFEASPDAGNENSKDASLKELKKSNKFFGGADKKFAWASGNKLDLGGEHNKRIPAYQFKAGETYTLTVSGRSQKFKLDQIMFSPAKKIQGKKNKKRNK